MPPIQLSSPRRAHLPGAALSLLLLFLTSLLTGCSPPSDERFPPYDNSAEAASYYQSQPEFFRTLPMDSLPKDLTWETGMDLPDIGSDEAIKGGTIRWFMTSFPPCIRPIGPDANSSFRSEHYDDIYVTQNGAHPNFPGKYYPGVCNNWAVSADKKTVFFRIDPAARFDNGRPVTVADFMMTFYIRRSPYAQDPYGQNYFGTKFSGIDKYDELTFAIRLPEARPDPIYFAQVPPMDHVFYKEFGPDFPQRYQWRKEPSAGAYTILPEDIKIGRSITMRRVKDWWAKDRKYFKNRFNVDAIQFEVIQNPEKAFQAFLAGRLDFYHTYLDRLPAFWHEKLDVDPFHNGWIGRAQFYNDYPRPSQGLYLNSSKPLLNNINIRRGLQHAMNMQRVIDVELKGDMDRMRTVSDGYGPHTHPTLQPAVYSSQLSSAAFAEAGFTTRGPDGVYRNPSTNQRLSFELSIRSRPQEQRYALRLKEEAIKCGVELRIEALDPSAQFKKVQQKQHEIALAGWVHIPPYPDYWQGYHSDNAYEKEKNPDGSRKVKVNTNNISLTANPEMDQLIDRHEKAQSVEELMTLGHRIQEMIVAEASFVPAWTTPWHRTVFWRWVRWPADFNVRVSETPAQSHVHWIDETIRQQTREAMNQNQALPIIDQVFDQYRQKN
jgi:microcin C transport system substrate-binding protein